MMKGSKKRVQEWNGFTRKIKNCILPQKKERRVLVDEKSLSLFWFFFNYGAR